MNISMQNIRAILVKDYKEFSRNYAVSTMALLPIFLAFIYGQAGSNDMQSYMMPINLTFAAVTCFIQCCLIAEEKENNTLRSLMLSPASTADILLGKSALVYVITAIVLALSMYLISYPSANLYVFSGALAISAVFYIALGIICSLFTKTIMEASLAVLPVMAIFSFGPMGLLLADQYPILKAIEWLPSAQLILIEESLSASNGLNDVFVSFGVLIAWTVVAIVIATILYKKRMTDE